MSDHSQIERITRSLAFMLRHQPEKFDLDLDEHGYADLSETVRALNERLGEPIEEEDVVEAVRSGDRVRYEIDGDRIRALYGHSIPVEAGPPSKPPETLYVAIPTREVDRARRFGLRGGRRRFLHLALTADDARSAGRRAARDYTVLHVRALEAWEEGVNFYDRISLWLAEEVPTHLIEVEGSYEDGTDPERFDRASGGRGSRRDSGRRGSREGRMRGGNGRSRGRDDDRGSRRDGRRRGDRRRGGEGRSDRDDRRRGPDRQPEPDSRPAMREPELEPAPRHAARESAPERPESAPERRESAPERRETVRPPAARPSVPAGSGPARPAPAAPAREPERAPFGAGVLEDVQREPRPSPRPTPPPPKAPAPPRPEPQPEREGSSDFGAGL